MTPLPKRKLSTRRQGDRRSHFKLSLFGLFKCKNCDKPMLLHRVCPNCGFYKGKLVKSAKVKKTKAAHNHDGHAGHNHA